MQMSGATWKTDDSIHVLYDFNTHMKSYVPLGYCIWFSRNERREKSPRRGSRTGFCPNLPLPGCDLK